MSTAQAATFMALAVIGLALMSGCRQDEEPTTPEAPEAPTEQMKEGVEEATKGAKKWAAETKEDMVQTTEDRIAELQEKIDELGQQASEQGEEAQQKWENELKPELESKVKAARDKLDELRDSSGDAWGDLKTGIQTTIGDLQDAYEAAKQEMQE